MPTPLAARLRPSRLNDVVGHQEVLAPLARQVATGSVPSLVLFGPPGVGKTTIARALANELSAVWRELSATSCGVKDVRAELAAATTRRDDNDEVTLLFIDEVHRFNKSQQDALLPAVEDGTVTLVAATTQNPFFEVNAPLLSRCRLLPLQPLTDDDIGQLIDRALRSPAGLDSTFTLAADIAEVLVRLADGDGRAALNTLEAAAALAASDDSGVLRREHLDEVTRRLRYDRAGDGHYDQISAFIKSLRGSDPDAAIYWLVRILAAGEDPRFIARRMVVLASEDVGLADRSALPSAVAAFNALEQVGLPEARYNLAHAAITLALAPKSNAVTRALADADRLIDRYGNLPVPDHLADGHYAGASELGRGVSYLYPHDDPSGFVTQNYLPNQIVDETLYIPTEHGHEAPAVARLAHLWPAKRT